MPIIPTKTRFPIRCMVLAGLSVFPLIGVAGAVNTLETANADRAEEVRRAAMGAEEVARLGAERRVAEEYAELQMAQANCGSRLQGFYYIPGQPLAEQLRLWGIDWGARVWQTDHWQPLIDSSERVVGAIRVDPGTGELRIISIDEEPGLSEAAMCNRNQLTD